MISPEVLSRVEPCLYTQTVPHLQHPCLRLMLRLLGAMLAYGPVLDIDLYSHCIAAYKSVAPEYTYISS